MYVLDFNSNKIKLWQATKRQILGIYLNITEAIIEPTANIILNDEKLKALSPRSGKRQRCPLSPLLFNIVLEVLVAIIREEKEMKEIKIGKEVKLSLFADDMILYIEDAKHVTRKLLEPINEFGKVAGYKINSQKSFAFLYTNNKRSEREIKETISFTITSKRIKYLETHTQGCKRLVLQKLCKILMKEIKDDKNRWRDIPCSWVGRINVVKMTVPHKVIYRFNTIPMEL